MHDHFELNIK